MIGPTEGCVSVSKLPVVKMIGAVESHHPWTGKRCLMGNVVGHPTRPDGSLLFSGPILRGFADNSRRVTCRDAVYIIR